MQIYVQIFTTLCLVKRKILEINSKQVRSNYSCFFSNKMHILQIKWNRTQKQRNAHDYICTAYSIIAEQFILL